MVLQNTSTHPTARKLFEGRKIVVATMHGKHHVMKPLLKQYLNINAVVVPELDTDEFGTFSGEVERPFDPVTTLRKKIIKGLKAANETLGIGNEGSFGPHPQIPFIQANQEVVMLIDLANDIEITEQVISTDTNHAQQEITCLKDLLAFTEKINFPAHGIILKQINDGKVINIRKGILTWELLYAVSLQFKSNETKLIAETDMRGYLNPTRMRVIEKATESLMKRITSLCPECQWPGFGVVEEKPGLPCRDCGEATQLTFSKLYQCKQCGFTDQRFYTGVQHADPQHCDQCNP